MLQSLLPKPPIIHLALFHGIGVSQLALQYLNTNVIKTFSWEIDPFCNELLDHQHHQQIEHMGDATQTDFPTFCRQLSESYDNTHVILITSAPPSKDHSRVRDAPPVSGSDGSLIQQMTHMDLTIRQQLPTYTIRSLMENVLPHCDVQQQVQDISTQSGTHPIIVDAADGQVTSRPRLWWLDADWKYVGHQLTSLTPFTLRRISPTTQPHCHDDPTVHTCERVGNSSCAPLPKTAIPLPYHTGAHRPRTTMATGQQTIPTVAIPTTIPYPTTRRRVQPITPLQRERLMALPDNYTRITDQHPSTRTRNTMLGNAWHFSSALWLITLLLMIPTATALYTPPTQSTIQKLTELWLSSQTLWGPPAKTTQHQHMPQLDWHSHCRWARTLQDPTADHSNLDPSLCWTIDQSHRLPNIQQIRQSVTDELRQLVEDQQEITTTWFQHIPPHCQQAYKQTDMITQIPTLIHILDSIHYPHTKQLQQELSQGFSLLGNLHPGLNWHVRADSKYTCPTSIETLRQHNRQYIQKKLQQNHVDPHWQLMATEIATEVQQGRMAGPFQAPEWLQTRTSPLKKYSHTSSLLPLPHPDPIIAMAFSIEQTGSDGKQKEDWRRCGHNQACHMTDQPYTTIHLITTHGSHNTLDNIQMNFL